MSTTSEVESVALRIELFGQFALAVAGRAVPALSRSARSLVSLLALRSPRPLERDYLAANLWPDSDDAAARYNLRRTLTELRSALGSEASRLETPAPQMLRFDLSGDAFCDVAAFDTAVAVAAKGGADIAALEVAVETYAARGVLLAGERADWIVPERAVRAENYLAARESLAAFCRERGVLDDAIRHLRAVLAVDSMRETAVRGLMRALNESGQNAAALAEYQNLRDILRANTDAAPDAETTRLYTEIRMAGQSPASEKNSRAVASVLVPRLTEIHDESRTSGPIEFPTGAVTFLFTDIEGSTRNWEAHPDRMSAALSRHDALMRDAIESAQGVVFKTIGDGFYAVFALPANALAAAVQAQRVLRNEIWPDDVPIAVRMALHTGVPELRNGDYFGNPLNRAARLLATAHGGQVLVSAATHELIRDSLPAEIGLYNLGHQNLKDLDRPEDVFAATHPDLADPASFPSVRIAKTPTSPNNLPRPTTSFVGRELQIQEIGELLAKTGLLTLVGPGGAGKTRLALQVASGVLDRYPDGIWFVELAPISDATLVPQAVAQALGVKEQTGQSISYALAEFLKSKQALILLDNCEHVVEACARLAIALLNECPGLTLLATSREPLAVSGEQSYRVPPLSLPDPKMTRMASVHELSQYESVRLFVERALLVNLDFTVTDATAPALAQLCHRLDGIPLALELAAARIRSLSVDEINARLGDRFRLLTSNNRSVLPRQQTLRALVDWSYDLLSEPEKLLFERLSVFVGGWTIEAAESVCGFEPLEGLEVLDLLMGLVDKSLVLAEAGAGGSRYRMLETIRQYAAEKLLASHELETVSSRHRDWVFGLAENADLHLQGADETFWLASLETEHDNIRVALAFSAKNALATPTAGSVEPWLHLAGLLGRFWEIRGYAEGREHINQALDAARPFETIMHTGTAARALISAGIQARNQGDIRTAQALYEEALAIHKETDNPVGVALVLKHLAVSVTDQGDYSKANRLYEESLAILRESANATHGMIWDVINGLGLVAYSQGDYPKARPLFEEALAGMRLGGNPQRIAIALNNLALIASDESDFVKARALHEESLALRRATGDNFGVAMSLGNIGIVAYRQQDFTMARSFFQEALALNRRMKADGSVANALFNLGELASVMGNFAEARLFFGESLATYIRLGDLRLAAFALDGLGSVLPGESHLRKGVVLRGAADSMLAHLGTTMAPADVNVRTAQLEEARAALGDAAFSAAWEEGRQLTWEQATQIALTPEP